MRERDALLTPTLPITATPLAEVDEATTPLATWTRAANYLGACALSLPAGFSADGLPIGVQLTGARVRRGDARRDRARIPAGRPTGIGGGRRCRTSAHVGRSALVDRGRGPRRRRDARTPQQAHHADRRLAPAIIAFQAQRLGKPRRPVQAEGGRVPARSSTWTEAMPAVTAVSTSHSVSRRPMRRCRWLGRTASSDEMRALLAQAHRREADGSSAVARQSPSPSPHRRAAATSGRSGNASRAPSRSDRATCRRASAHRCGAASRQLDVRGNHGGNSATTRSGFATGPVRA